MDDKKCCGNCKFFLEVPIKHHENSPVGMCRSKRGYHAMLYDKIHSCVRHKYAIVRRDLSTDTLKGGVAKRGKPICLEGRPKREMAIQKEDVVDLKINLGVAEGVDQFLALI